MRLHVRPRLRPALAVALVACLSLARPVSAQDSLAFSAAGREASAQLESILASARDKRLPTEPIIAKARQGMLLRAPAARIVAAAQAVTRRMEQARDALAPNPTASDIAAGQDGLSIAGVTPEMLQLIRLARPARPVAVPVGVMAQLVASGVNPPHAAEIVARLARGTASDVQFVALGNDVNADVARGTKADAALQLRLARLTPLLARQGAGSTTTNVAAAAGGGKPPNP